VFIIQARFTAREKAPFDVGNIMPSVAGDTDGSGGSGMKWNYSVMWQHTGYYGLDFVFKDIFLLTDLFLSLQ